MIDPEERRLVEGVADIDPELTTLLFDHRRTFGGDTLPSLFLADLARWAASRFVSGNDDVVVGLLDFLEESFSDGSENLRNLIAVGFIESMPHSREQGGEIRRLLGPSMAQEYEKLNS